MEFDENMALNYSNCLNFSRNCTIVAAFARTWLSDELGVDDKAVAAYFRQALPPMLQRQPTNGQLIDWYYDLQINVSFIPSFDACLDPVCKAVDWSGVPDILGPGAVFSTLLPALFIWKMRLNRQGITPGSRLRWVFEVQNAITGILINTCLLLNFAIDIAAIVVIARRDSLGESTQVTLAFQLTLFSIFGFIILAVYPTTMYDTLEAYPFPMIIYGTNIALYFVVIGLALPSASLEYVNSSWEIYCSWGIMSKLPRGCDGNTKEEENRFMNHILDFWSSNVGPSNKYHCVEAAVTREKWLQLRRFILVFWSDISNGDVSPVGC
ncbi:unnamed protein product [Fusarium venenatum]|uniref:Uncharacterized protein n=1 Tax=Fusarium venenatum TaxID=56646 RepID=A0A2L2T9F6_9HYPO|nr:uncharacterized protein FVRRES_04056 [Fusarium venenatum]CEI67544.1 unnamed protein product [Fusarium venenatum]